MRVKAYTAKTMPAALRMIRKDMGEDAIIISVWKRKNGIEVRAAGERAQRPAIHDRERLAAADLDANVTIKSPISGPFADTLRQQVFQPSLISNLCPERNQSYENCVQAAEEAFTFSPLNSPNRPIMLVGQAGVGKTTLMAKLAARHALRGDTPHMILTDGDRAGARQQVQTFGQLMDARVSVCDGFLQTRETLLSTPGPSIIETAAPDLLADNPFAELAPLLQQNLIQPILVLPAASLFEDTLDLCDKAKRAGIDHTIIVRTDETRRMGPTLSAIAQANMKIVAISKSPYIARGLRIADAGSLVRAILGAEDNKVMDTRTKATTETVTPDTTPVAAPKMPDSELSLFEDVSPEPYGENHQDDAEFIHIPVSSQTSATPPQTAAQTPLISTIAPSAASGSNPYLKDENDMFKDLFGEAA